jgi:Trk K+ transport system NAD-binding subunit
MKILILGAGRVGESVAESLVSEQNDITVIDTDPARLARCRTGSTCAAWSATASSPRC